MTVLVWGFVTREERSPEAVVQYTRSIRREADGEAEDGGREDYWGRVCAFLVCFREKE